MDRASHPPPVRIAEVDGEASLGFETPLLDEHGAQRGVLGVGAAEREELHGALGRTWFPATARLDHEDAAFVERKPDARRGTTDDGEGEMPLVELREPVYVVGTKSQVMNPHAHDATTPGAEADDEARLVDAHGHLDLAEDPEGEARAAIARGVHRFVVAGVSAGTLPHVHGVPPWRLACGSGIHPWTLTNGVDPRALDSVARTAEVADFVGEFGLDRIDDVRRGRDAKVAEDVFETLVALSTTLGKSAVIHVVHAHDRALGLLARARSRPPFVVHAFRSSGDVALRYARLGGYLSVGHDVLDARNGARWRDVVARVGLSSLVLESDAPDPRAAGKRRARDVADIAASLAEFAGATSTEVARRTTENAERLFFAGRPRARTDGAEVLPSPSAAMDR